jgi:hypothetical protein
MLKAYDWTLFYDSETDEDFVPTATSARDHDLLDSDSDSDRDDTPLENSDDDSTGDGGDDSSTCFRGCGRASL